jgi:hypothetical protein
MQSASEADVDDAPRWALWLVALICFGPLTLTWLLGVLILPFWAGLLAELLSEPEHFAHDPSATIATVALPIGLVIGGFIGLVGLLRVLTLSGRERPKSHRIFTIAMVAVGLVTLLAFHRPFVEGGIDGLADVISVAGVVYLVLPLAGAGWLLCKSWRLLVAGSTEGENRRPRTKRELRDDWRLDA